MMNYELPVPSRPGVGCFLVKLPPKIEKIGSLYIDKRYDSGSESSYQDEVERVKAEVLKSKEGQYLLQRKKMKELDRLIEREVFRIPASPPQPAGGEDRWNTVNGIVMVLPARMPVDRKTKKPVVCDVRVGDRVYFHYLTLANAADWHNSGCLYEYGDERWACIPYDTIFFSMRMPAINPSDKMDEIVMHNGWCLVEPIKKQDEEHSGIVVPASSEYEKTHGKIYSAPEGSELAKGDVVYWERESDVPLEYDLNRTFPVKLYRMKYDDIFAKLEV